MWGIPLASRALPADNVQQSKCGPSQSKQQDMLRKMHGTEEIRNCSGGARSRCRGSSLTRISAPLGPYRRTKAYGGLRGGGGFFCARYPLLGGGALSKVSFLPLFEPRPTPGSASRGSISDRCVCAWVQGYLAHKKTPTALGAPKDLRHRPTVRSYGSEMFCEGGTLVAKCVYLGPEGT